MLVPAFAGSTPPLANAKGRAVPATTDVMTMRKREVEMAAALARFPLVRYTLMKPPTAAHMCGEIKAAPLIATSAVFRGALNDSAYTKGGIDTVAPRV